MRYVLGFSLLWPLSAQALSLAEVIDNAMGPISSLGLMVNKAVLLLGIGLVVGGIVRYVEYRRNPTQAPMSSVVLLLVLGVVLFLAGYVSQYSDGGQIISGFTDPI